MKLKKSGFESFIRLSSSSPVTEESIKDHVKSSSSFKNMQEIGQTLDKNYVIACSCHKVNDDLLLTVKFDYCIMDNASAVNEPMAIGSILMAEKFVMFGDLNLVKPQVKSVLARRKGLGVSLFERLYLAHPQRASTLPSPDSKKEKFSVEIIVNDIH